MRSGFQSLQLVVTDFLPIMPFYCLQISVGVAAKFGLQNEDVNISLTAVGLIVSIRFRNVASLLFIFQEYLFMHMLYEMGEEYVLRTINIYFFV